MRFIRTNLVLFSLICGALSGVAQTARWEGPIPFPFKIKNHVFPAGVYDVSVDINHGVLSLANRLHPGEQMTMLGIPTDRKERATISFISDGGSYTMKSIAAGSWMSQPHSHTPKGALEASVVFPQR